MPVALRTPGRILSAACAALAVVLSGCDSKPGYPTSLEYASRSDRLVIRVPTVQPAGLGEPGKLDAELAALDSLGGETFHPWLASSGHRQAIAKFLGEALGS